MSFETKPIDREAAPAHAALQGQGRACHEACEKELLGLESTADRARAVRDEVVAGDLDEQTSGSTPRNDSSVYARVLLLLATCTLAVHHAARIAYVDERAKGLPAPD